MGNYSAASAAVKVVEGKGSSCLHDVGVCIPAVGRTGAADVTSVVALEDNVEERVEVDGLEVSFPHLDGSFFRLEGIRGVEVVPFAKSMNLDERRHNDALKLLLKSSNKYFRTVA